ncbi:MAG: putative porin [Bacteroidales bacterium]|nr:putative porin [Bacteroidales bacterium]
MKRIVSFIFLIFLCCSSYVAAQQRLSNQYGSSASGLDRGNYDRNGNPIDTTAVVDANTIPIGLYAWKVDSRFGNVTYVPIDTLQHQFQNSNDVGGITGQYNYLGNLGSPRLTRIFFDRRDPSQYLFTDPYDFCVLRPEDVTFTNTLSPFTNLSYYKGGSSRYGEERFKSYFAINANKKLGFGFYIDYIYGRGLYTNQSTALFNGGLFSSYRGEKYDMHFIFNNDNLKMAENGGITDDRYITSPLDMAEGKKEYSSSEIPTRLNQIWNHNTSYHAFLSHRYNLGFYKEKTDSVSADSVKTTEVFVPVTSFIHTVQVDLNNRKYISYDYNQNNQYFEHNYLGTDSIDNTKRTSVKNTIGIALQEGFNKWAQAGLTAFLSYEFRNFALTDTTDVQGGRVIDHFKESSLSIGGELSKKQGKLLHYNVLGEIAIAGEDAGQFSVEGKGDLNVKLFGDTVRLDANVFVKNQNPVFYYRHFQSKHYWWDNNDLSKIFRTRIEGKLTIDKWGTQLRAGVENIKNYTYLANTSTPITGAEGEITGFKNNAAVFQHSGNIQVFSAILNQRLRAGIFHLDAEVAYQKTSEADVLPLPELSAYGNLYMKFGLAKKVLQIEMGADARYFSKYYAPDYSVAMGQFYNQNPNEKIEIGGFPVINVYANLHLKRTRFFVMMYHINAGSGTSNYFLAPHYPMNPRMFKFGLSWNFFD